MRVTIVSHFSARVWQGEMPGNYPSPDEIYRFFNVVDAPDIERLRAIGYEQESMSNGDLVYHGEMHDWFLIQSTGFEPVSMRAAMLYYGACAVAAQGRDEGQRSPAYARVITQEDSGSNGFLPGDVDGIVTMLHKDAGGSWEWILPKAGNPRPLIHERNVR